MATTNKFLPVPVNNETIAALDAVAANKDLTVGSQFQRAFAMATAVGQLRALLTPEVMKPIMALQGTPLGFLADNKYDENTVREALIEAVLSGVRPVGNEFNIIAGRCYLTKNGMKHKLHDIPGLSFSVTCGFPKMSDTGAALIVGVDWSLNGGKAEHKDLPIPVRVNRGMGADAIAGKATRKAYAWLYEHITGQGVNEAETNEDAPEVSYDAETTATPAAASTAAAAPSPAISPLEQPAPERSNPEPDGLL